MTTDQILILAILLATIGMFLWGRWRHDMVAVAALLACVLFGLVPFKDAFSGFSHPAVITVACVLVLSYGLYHSGAVDVLTRAVLPTSAGPTLTIAALTGLGAILSGFMNNVGALALLMPVAIKVAAREKLAPGRVLMPVAFGSILGGMTTLVGTPPNLIASAFRAEAGLGPFAMFDFTPVGLAVAAAGVLFVALVGWRLVPVRERAGAEGFEIAAYLTEAIIVEGSKAAGKTLGELEAALEDSGAQIVGLVRNEVRLLGPSPSRFVHAGDILVIEAEVESLTEALSRLGLKLAAAERPEKDEKEPAEPPAQERRSGAGNKKESAPPIANGEAPSKRPEKSADDEIALVELAVLPQAAVVGLSASDIELSTRRGINLLALSRQGRRSTARLRTMKLAAGDVLLMQGAPDALADFAADAGCVPLAERPVRIPKRRTALLASGIMLAAVGAAATGLVPAAVSFAAAVLVSMALRTVPPRAVYKAVDWPVVVLLAALIPVAGAMGSTGSADLIGRFLLDFVARGHAVVALALILVVTMLLTDLMNNAATAAVMCPIALGTAAQLGVRPDGFLMAVAIGASCAFLTPIGHQNNTLILGPGGFHFGDYWRMGLPLDVLVAALSIPMLLWVWPL